MCALCLRDDQEIRDSHILSKWTYKRIRGSGSHPDPVRVSNDRAFQTSEQVTEYLLCGDCEQRRCVDERYASRITYQKDGSAPFFDHVLRLSEPEPGQPALAFPTTTLDCEAILRFGASTLWLSHLSPQVSKCSLRSDPAEVFRRYLLGEVGFPSDAACLLFFYEDSAGQGSPVDLLCTLPLTVSGDDFDSHRLIVCGLHFEFAIGSAIPEEYREFCFAWGNPRHVLLSSHDLAVDWLGPTFSAAKRGGVFARKTQAHRG